MSLCLNWLFHVIDSCSFAVPAALLAIEGMLPTFERSMTRYGPFTKIRVRSRQTQCSYRTFSKVGMAGTTRPDSESFANHVTMDVKSCSPLDLTRAP